MDLEDSGTLEKFSTILGYVGVSDFLPDVHPRLASRPLKTWL